jgi:hypothetical protein
MLGDKLGSGFKIYKDFKNGVFYEEIYEKYEITEDILIKILNRNIKGNYDYKRILSGGLEAQKQFNSHLKSRWNPLKPEPFENISPYIPKKNPEKEKE